LGVFAKGIAVQVGKDNCSKESLMSDDEKVYVYMVFAHRVFFDGKKMGYLWYSLDRELDNYVRDKTKQRWFYLPKKGGNLVSASTGSVFKFESKNEGSSVISSTAEYQRRFENNDLVTEWSVLNRSAMLEQEELRIQRKAARFSHLQNSIEPIRDAYKNLNARERVAFVLWLMREFEK
jgi:hypothetical protein